MRAEKPLLLFAAVLGLGACGTTLPPMSPPAAPKEAVLMEWNGPFSSVSRPEVRLVKTEAEWDKLWKDIGAPEAPVADLQVHLAVAVFLGQRNTGGYSVKLLDAVTRQGKVLIRYRESVPRGITFQALTYPYAVRLYKKTGAEIAVEEEKKNP